MSYILDALRKSESERQQQHRPGFADIPHARRAKATPLWIWLLAALLLINATVLAVLLLDRQPAAGTQQLALELPTVDDASQPTFREVVNEARDQVPARQAAALQPPADPPVTADRSPAPPPQAPPAEPAQTKAASPAAARSVPSFMELRANGELQLPDLHLDIHVFSQNPADRFVFINMSKYREQARLAEGPLLKEIRNDGVLLEHRGREFLLLRE